LEVTADWHELIVLCQCYGPSTAQQTTSAVQHADTPLSVFSPHKTATAHFAS